MIVLLAAMPRIYMMLILRVIVVNVIVENVMLENAAAHSLMMVIYEEAGLIG